MLILWIGVFVVSLAVMVKGADWLISSAEKIGLALGLSPFIVGVTIVGVGTSLPELISSGVAAWQGLSEVVAANAVGSNIANIFLIIGFAAVLGRKLFVSKDLIDIDLPLLAISTALLLGVLWDREVTLGESLLLLVSYGIYFSYTIFHKEAGIIEKETKKSTSRRPSLVWQDILMLGAGLMGLIFGAKYLIAALVNLSAILNIGAGVIAITAVALGTSLPELLVSAKAAISNKPEVALGNIFGSNVFNALVVVGLPGLFWRLNVDEQTFLIGLPTMAMATLLFVISGISRRIYVWEGSFYLALYILFTAKLFGWF